MEIYAKASVLNIVQMDVIAKMVPVLIVFYRGMEINVNWSVRKIVKMDAIEKMVNVYLVSQTGWVKDVFAVAIALMNFV